MNGIFDSNAAAVPAVTANGTNGAIGIESNSDTGTGLRSSGKIAIFAGCVNGTALSANCIGDGTGVEANCNNGFAVNAQSEDGIGVLGLSETNVGIQGFCKSGYNFGILGEGPNAGVAAFNPNNTNAAYLASDCCAAWFTGGVAVTGRISKGGGGFKIDHPLDPAGKFLNHSFVESPDMKNFYDGIIIANKKGEAVVQLPKWFDAVNRDFTYQLTAVGAAAPNLHVRDELKNGRFTIAGAPASMKISWQITGIRKDVWAVANSIPVEEPKKDKEKGYYLHPELYKQSRGKAIGTLRHPRTKTIISETFKKNSKLKK
jgi:hypothetical protein